PAWRRRGIQEARASECSTACPFRQSCRASSSVVQSSRHTSRVRLESRVEGGRWRQRDKPLSECRPQGLSLHDATYKDGLSSSRIATSLRSSTNRNVCS